MTASEKLRELAAKTDDPFWASEVQQGWLIDVGNALPLIADLAGTAEEYRRIQFTKPPTEVQHAGAKLDRALTALREHLEEGDVT